MPDLFTPLNPLPAPIVFAVPSEPRGQGRPRGRVIAGHVDIYKDPKSRAYEAMVKGYARAAMAGKPPLLGQLHLEMVAYCGITESWTKKKKEAALAGGLDSVGAFDLDNIVKSALDGMNKVVFADDCQISSICARKEYSHTPRLAIAVVPAAEGKFAQPKTVLQCEALINNLVGVGLLQQSAHKALFDALALYRNYHGEQLVV